MSRRRPRPRLVAEQFEAVRLRADEGDAGFCAGTREVRILAQEAVSRMARVAAGRARGLDQLP